MTPSRRAPAVATIGVYGFDEESFLRALERAEVRLLLDVRQRRNVRGPEYSWANAVRLQRALTDSGVAYRHVKELAPTTALRQVQYAEDDRRGVGKRDRDVLAAGYADGYTREILDPFDLDGLVAGLPRDATSALFCVERDPEACHRSLVARRLRDGFGLAVTDLRPG
ncbi:hypothetical protein Val02_22740 [Virgisporangium aliadipatigenens]|uniref:DUF488 domain-containing protein n=1 Tax=Virgisporangium aliadipatigenens TaxID=741659 RepID=A0A8J4DQ61_9ACTN|nr:DUF488 domain-containing protein [Virgisporangium aliadipatigenens]GIJ45388.1 hypothetical protein Val02_22740 [Virgisporangium aliadipatigenens]